MRKYVDFKCPRCGFEGYLEYPMKECMCENSTKNKVKENDKH